MKKTIGTITLSYLLSAGVFHYKSNIEEKVCANVPYYRIEKQLESAQNYKELRNQSALLTIISAMLLVYPKNREE